MIKSSMPLHPSQLPTAKTFWVAYSGGLDSHVLLHSVSTYFTDVRAIHVHHGLNAQADLWASHCQQTCKSLNIPLTIEKIQLPTPHQNIEALAREKRYEVFSKIIGPDEALLTAHHQDDQAETLLLQLFRGAGLKGLSSMAEKMSFGQGVLLRPFLHISQSTIRQYALTHQLAWIEDDSNNNLQFQRNFLRQQLIPLIQTQWPGIHKTLSRSAGHMANAQTLLETLATQDLKEIIQPNQTLWIPALCQLSTQRQQNVIRYWLTQRNLPLPSQQKLQSIQKTVLNCNPDANPIVTWTGVEIRRYRQQLYALNSAQNTKITKCYEWNLNENLEIEGASKPLTKEALTAQGIHLPSIEKLTIRFRQGGERCLLPGHTHSKSLKKLFQAWGIPPWERNKIPLIYHNDQLIAVWR